jgi:RNA polymerase sigma-70 factor (ECF subfamily)
VKTEHEWQQHEYSLFLRAQKGDREAMASIYQMYADRLYRQVIYPCVAHSTTAEDLLKETFVRVMQQIKNYCWNEKHGLFPWLSRIARNLALDYHRSTSRHGRLNCSYRQHIDLLCTTPSPDMLLEEKEENAILQQKVQTCLLAINPRYRQAIELRLFRELPREECAAILEISVATFDVLFFRALRAFRSAWTPNTDQQ